MISKTLFLNKKHYVSAHDILDAKKIEVKVKGSTNIIFSAELLALMTERDLAK